MSIYKIEIKINILVEKSYKGDEARFKEPNIWNNVIYRTKAFK